MTPLVASALKVFNLLAHGLKSSAKQIQESWCVTSHYVCYNSDPKNVSVDNSP